MTTTQSTAPDSAARYHHRMVDGRDIGVGPGRYCERCGVRDGTPAAERMCGVDVRMPAGVKSDYDPLA